MPLWYGIQARPRSLAGLVPYLPPVSSAPRNAGIGARIPERESDCSGVRPSWYPFQINVCDAEFDPADPDLTHREMTTEPEA